MASRPKETRLKRKLAAIAKREGFATPIEWVVSEVASGVSITQMARDVAALELPGHPPESFSRNWFSMIANRLQVPEGGLSAKEQIAAARKEAAHVLVDDAISIADEVVSTSAEVQRNRLRSDVRLRLAGLWNREEFSERPSVAVNVDLGALHLAALRRRAISVQPPPMLESGEPDYEFEA